MVAGGLAVLALASAGCGDGSDGTDPDAARTAALAAQLREIGGEYQQEVLADGVVTPAEYEESVLATMACITERGLRAEGPLPSMDGRLLMIEIAFSGDAVGNDTEEEDRLADAVFDACSAQYLEHVEWVYIQQVLPTGEERTEEIAAFRDCIAATGADAPSTATPSELYDLAVRSSRPEAFECTLRHQLLFVEVDQAR